MDTNKWKSVLLPRDVYENIVVISHVEGRTISGQLRVIFESWKNANLSSKDQRYLQEELEKYRQQISNGEEDSGEEPVYSI